MIVQYFGQRRRRHTCLYRAERYFFSTGRCLGDCIAKNINKWECMFGRQVQFSQVSAVVYSLMLTCRASRVDPLAWLRHVLTELPRRAVDADITDLLPFNFTNAAAA